MELTFNVDIAIMDTKVQKTINILSRCGINASIRHTGMMKRQLVLPFDQEPTPEDILSMGVLIGQTLYMD